MISLLMIFLLLFGGAALAQDEASFVFCDDLSEADCQLLKDSQAVMMDVQAASTDFDMTLSISDIPDTPMESLSFHLSGTGSYIVDPAFMESMKSMQSNPTAMFSSPEAYVELMGEVANGISADVNLTLTLPAELTAMLSTEEQPVPEALSIDLRLVDGFAYVNLDEIASAIPDANVPPGWVGIDLATAMEMAMSQADMSGAMGMDSETMQEYLSTFQDPEAMSEFLTIERVEDSEVMGQPVAVFHSTFDYGAFFSSDMFQQMMQAQMEAAIEASGEEVSEEDMAEVEAMMSQMSTALQNMNLNMVQTVGLEDNYAYSFEMHLDWDMSEFMATVDPAATDAAPQFTFDLTATNSNFNDVAEIEAPEDATIFPIEDMMPAGTT